ncbi:MAG TPA: hypothetical protein PKI61_04170 [bacterium]|nr:hypothetical protein [bacterium]
MFCAMIALVVALTSCEKEVYYKGGEPNTDNPIDTTGNGNGNNNNNNGTWSYSPSNAYISGNEFSWDISNSSLNPTGKTIYVVWISDNGILNYNKLSEGVAGVFGAGTVTAGVIKMSLSPGYGKIKFNFAVNGGPPNNKWYWFTAQGSFVQLPCQHTSGGWCYDDSLNNMFSALYSGGNWTAGDPCN